MARPMQIAQPVMNVRPYQAHGPILGHALELLVPATVTGGGRHAHRIDAPAFSWWETITHWQLNGGVWVQQVPVTGPVDQALGRNQTADWWRNRYANAAGEPQWNPNWPRNPENGEAERLIAQNGLSWTIRVYDHPGMNNPRYQPVPGAPRELARAVEFRIRIGLFLIRKTQVLASSTRGDCQRMLDGTHTAAAVVRMLP